MNVHLSWLCICLIHIAIDFCVGRYISAIVSCFLDGMIGFYFARKGENEEKWVSVANSCITSFRMWESRWVTGAGVEARIHIRTHFSTFPFYCKHAMIPEHPITSPTSWNYSGLNKSDCALLHYQNTINLSKKYRFIHEEGLAEETYATYLLHLHRNDDAYEHFNNACNCYKKWGAAVLVQRVEKVIGLLTPLCSLGK